MNILIDQPIKNQIYKKKGKKNKKLIDKIKDNKTENKR